MIIIYILNAILVISSFILFFLASSDDDNVTSALKHNAEHPNLKVKTICPNVIIIKLKAGMYFGILGLSMLPYSFLQTENGMAYGLIVLALVVIGWKVLNMIRKIHDSSDFIHWSFAGTCLAVSSYIIL